MYIINYNLIAKTNTECCKNTTKDIKHLKPDILIMGDFNFPRLQWPNGKLISGGTKVEKEQVMSLLQLIDAIF